MAYAIDSGAIATKKPAAKTYTAANPISTPQQALNAVINKQPTPTYINANTSPQSVVSNLSSSAGITNYAKSSGAGAGGASGSLMGAISQPNTRVPSTTPQSGTDYSGGVQEPGSGGYSNPRASGVTMYSGGSYAPPATTPAADETPVETPETAFETKLKELLAANNESAKTAYDTAKQDSDSYLEKQLKEAYISRMMAEKALPQQMAAQGLTGGAVESTLAGNRNSYMNNRNDIYRTANERLRDATNTYQNNVAENKNAYTSSIADYLRELDMVNKQAAIDKELIAYRAQFD